MRSYPHMCRDEHIEIGHADSGDHERCPLCRANDRIAAYDFIALEWQQGALDAETAIRKICEIQQSS